MGLLGHDAPTLLATRCCASLLFAEQHTDEPASWEAGNSASRNATHNLLSSNMHHPSRGPPTGPPAPPRWHAVPLLHCRRVGTSVHLLRFGLPAGVRLGVGRHLGEAILLQVWGVTR